MAAHKKEMVLVTKHPQSPEYIRLIGLGRLNNYSRVLKAPDYGAELREFTEDIEVDDFLKIGKILQESYLQEQFLFALTGTKYGFGLYNNNPFGFRLVVPSERKSAIYVWKDYASTVAEDMDKLMAAKHKAHQVHTPETTARTFQQVEVCKQEHADFVKEETAQMIRAFCERIRNGSFSLHEAVKLGSVVEGAERKANQEQGGTGRPAGHVSSILEGSDVPYSLENKPTQP